MILANRFLTFAEARVYLFSKKIEANIIAIPPKVDELIGEEEADDENTALAKIT